MPPVVIRQACSAHRCGPNRERAGVGPGGAGQKRGGELCAWGGGCAVCVCARARASCLKRSHMHSRVRSGARLRPRRQTQPSLPPSRTHSLTHSLLPSHLPSLLPAPPPPSSFPHPSLPPSPAPSSSPSPFLPLSVPFLSPSLLPPPHRQSNTLGERRGGWLRQVPGGGVVCESERE